MPGMPLLTSLVTPLMGSYGTTSSQATLIAVVPIFVSVKHDGVPTLF